MVSSRRPSFNSLRTSRRSRLRCRSSERSLKMRSRSTSGRASNLIHGRRVSGCGSSTSVDCKRHTGVDLPHLCTSRDRIRQYHRRRHPIVHRRHCQQARESSRQFLCSWVVNEDKDKEGVTTRQLHVHSDILRRRRHPVTLQ